jgi:hypothetical protein
LQNRDPRFGFGMTFAHHCDHKFSITAIAVIENFILKIGEKFGNLNTKKKLGFAELHRCFRVERTNRDGLSNKRQVVQSMNLVTSAKSFRA